VIPVGSHILARSRDPFTKALKFYYFAVSSSEPISLTTFKPSVMPDKMLEIPNSLNISSFLVYKTAPNSSWPSSFLTISKILVIES